MSSFIFLSRKNPASKTTFGYQQEHIAFCYNNPMGKKLIILFILIGVSALGINYHRALVRERGENLVSDAYYGDLESVKEDVENGAALDFVFYFNDDEREYTAVSFNALHAAASGGNEDVINYLLDLDLDINAQTPDGWTPLFIAARDGHAEAAKLLIFREADLNIQTNLGASALLMAVTQPYPTEKERAELVTYMLKRGADPDLAGENSLPPLYFAATLQKLSIVEILLENKAAVTPQLYEQIAQYLQKIKTPQTQKILALLKKKLPKQK